MKYKISHKVKPNIKVSFNKNETKVTINGKMYSAKCHPEDRFDKEKGVLLCLAQAQGISYKKLTQLIPKASKPIVLTNELKMKNRTNFVKIIHPSIARNKEDYSKNSVLPIYKASNGRIIRYGKNPGQFLVPQEFVKLNNYKYPISNLYKLLKIVKSLYLFAVIMTNKSIRNNLTLAGRHILEHRRNIVVVTMRKYAIFTSVQL